MLQPIQTTMLETIPWTLVLSLLFFGGGGADPIQFPWDQRCFPSGRVSRSGRECATSRATWTR